MGRRILINATHTAETRFSTGIQRVVRRVAESARVLEQQLDARCTPVVCHSHRLFAAPRLAGQPGWDERLADRVHAGLATAGDGVREGLAKLSPAAACRAQQIGRRCRKLFYPRSLARTGRMTWAWLRGREVTIRRGDVLLMLDAAWNAPLWPYEHARRKGCHVAQVVYDLLPVTHPQYFAPRIVHDYQRWIEYALDHADSFWAISQTVRAELERFSQQRQLAAGQAPPTGKFRVFRLGADLAPPAADFTPRETIDKIFRDRVPVFISVGTIEARKNHAWLVQAFDRYWAGGGQAKLVLVGRAGWASDSIRDTIVSNPHFGSLLVWLDDASDQEVQYLYRHARSTIYPSLAEGFGLPIIESLHQGTGVLASDTPIHREVGQDRIAYFSLDDLEKLVQRIGQLADTPKEPGAVEPLCVPTWNDATLALLGDVLQEAGATGVSSCDRAA